MLKFRNIVNWRSAAYERNSYGLSPWSDHLACRTPQTLGIEPGGLVVVEERSGELVLRPATVVELETYSDEDIARWDQGDQLEAWQRETILKRLGTAS